MPKNDACRQLVEFEVLKRFCGNFEVLVKDDEVSIIDYRQLNSKPRNLTAKLFIKAGKSDYPTSAIRHHDLYWENKMLKYLGAFSYLKPHRIPKAQKFKPINNEWPNH